jgi:exopolysaccharide biosynthesis polyprenyl glycosylphosphotransferase
MNNKLQTAGFLIADFLSAALAWSLFFGLRKYDGTMELRQLFQTVLIDHKFYIGIICIPVFWILLYAISGSYHNVYRKSRMREIGQTMLVSVYGVILIFFVLILDDSVASYRSYYLSFISIFVLHFGITVTVRLLLVSRNLYKLKHGIIGFNTIIVGSNGNATSIYHELVSKKNTSFNRFVGFVYAVKYPSYKLESFIPNLGHFSNLRNLITELDIHEVIIAAEQSERDTIDQIISEVEKTDILIKVIPIMQDFLLGTVRTTSIYQTPLIQVSYEYMPPWQLNLKRLLDIILSTLAIIILSPVFLFCALGVKLSSKGPVLYKQERVGLNGMKFMIPKFRSMVMGAENGKPLLSSRNDNRVTSFGLFMRKIRLDEIPQFFSVLQGHMSLVGPRPERQYFIDQITQRAPHYRMLLKVKPGITSWGQVKYGYAENVDQMIERLKYDILYLQNMSLSMDFKIMAYTLLTVAKGSGQ